MTVATIFFAIGCIPFALFLGFLTVRDDSLGPGGTARALLLTTVPFWAIAAVLHVAGQR